MEQLSPRRSLSARQAETVDKLLRCALDEIRSEGFEGLRIRSVASRADVASATAYTYFASKEHLVTELFLQRLTAMAPAATNSSGPADDAEDSLPETADRPDTAGRPGTGKLRSTAERVAAALAPIAALSMAEPELASACTHAMLASDPEVQRVRLLIGEHTHALVREAAGSESTAAQLQTIEAAWSGLLLQAGMGHIRYSDLAKLAEQSAEVVFGREQP